MTGLIEKACGIRLIKGVESSYVYSRACKECEIESLCKSVK